MNRRNFLKTAAINGTAAFLLPDMLQGRDIKTVLPPNQKIKIGQIGVTHSHAAARFRTLRKMPDIFEIVGVVDDRPTRAAWFEEQDMTPFKEADVRWMTEKELFETPGLQAVIVETANTELVPVSLRCMERNLAIAMDKPGGEDLKLFKKLLDGCQRRNLPFQMGYMLRTNPAIQFIQKAVRENWLGDIFEIQAGMSHNYRGEAYQQYFGQYKAGNMFILGCHHVDWVVSLLGRPKKVTPFLGSTANALPGVKNNCRAVLEYPHAQVTIHISDTEVDGDANRRVKVCGTKGVIELRRLENFDGSTRRKDPNTQQETTKKPGDPDWVGLSLELRLKEPAGGYDKGNHVVSFETQTDRYLAQMNEFAQMVRGEIKSPYSFEHDYLAQEVFLAACGYLKI